MNKLFSLFSHFGFKFVVTTRNIEMSIFATKPLLKIFKRSITNQLEDWSSLNGQREIFSQFAKKNNMKELADWYGITVLKLENTQVQYLMNRYFDGVSLPFCLQILFPEYYWCLWKFTNFKLPRTYWDDQLSQRKKFDEVRNLGPHLKIVDW